MRRLTLKALGHLIPRASSISICLVLVSLIPTVPAMPEAHVPPEAIGEFERALGYFRSGNYQEALGVIEPLGKLHPDVAEIQHLVAIILDLNQVPQLANRHFRRAVELQPDSVIYRTNLGASLMRMGNQSEAIEQFHMALELDPNNPTANFNLGTIHLQRGDAGQAHPRLETAYAVQSDVYENAYQLAYCRFLLGKYAAVDTVLNGLEGAAKLRIESRLLKALTDRALGRADHTHAILREIKQEVAGRPQFQLQVGLLLMSQGLFEPAAELLELVARQTPRSYVARLNLARAQQGLERFADATRAARAALDIRETAETHSLLGDLLESQDKSLEAVEHFQKAVLLEPTAASFYALGHEFLIHWNWEAADKVFTAGLERFPDSWHLWVGAGASAMGLTQYEKATRAFLKAVELDPEELMAYNLLSQSFDQSEDAFAEAVNSFQKLFNRHPTGRWGQYFEALATYRRATRDGDTTQMAARVDPLIRLTRKNPEFLEAHLLLSEIQFGLQDWNGAVETLRRVVQLDPDHVSAHYRLGLSVQRLGKVLEAREILDRYRLLKSQENQTINERIAVTTQFIVDLK